MQSRRALATYAYTMRGQQEDAEAQAKEALSPVTEQRKNTKNYQHTFVRAIEQGRADEQNKNCGSAKR